MSCKQNKQGLSWRAIVSIFFFCAGLILMNVYFFKDIKSCGIISLILFACSAIVSIVEKWISKNKQKVEQ